jgi:hypothetical protein
VRNGCRTGGIEAERASGWSIRDNHVGGYFCALGNALGSIRFWRGSRDTEVVRNTVHNGRRGIVLGVGSDDIVRSYGDTPCGGIQAQHYGGLIANNFVWANDLELSGSASNVLDGIAVESACEVLVAHNAVYSVDPPSSASIVHRYGDTSGAVVNNAVHNSILRLDGSTATGAPNADNLADNMFVHAPSGDLHIAAIATTAIDQGAADHLAEIPDDIDGQPRDKLPDMGADER